MNPRRTAKADTYILAIKGILYGRRLSRLTMERQKRQKLIFETHAFIKNLALSTQLKTEN